MFIDDESFERGVNRLTPCADSQRRVLVWRPRSGAWAMLDWPGQGEVLQVHLPGGGAGLVQHCDLKASSESCLDVPIAAGTEADVTPLLHRLLAPEKGAFLAAVDALDRDALAAALRAGLFPH